MADAKRTAGTPATQPPAGVSRCLTHVRVGVVSRIGSSRTVDLACAFLASVREARVILIEETMKKD